MTNKTTDANFSFAMEIANEKKAEAAGLPRLIKTNKKQELSSGRFREAVAQLYGGGSRYAEMLEE